VWSSLANQVAPAHEGFGHPIDGLSCAGSQQFAVAIGTFVPGFKRCWERSAPQLADKPCFLCSTGRRGAATVQLDGVRREHARLRWV